MPHQKQVSLKSKALKGMLWNALDKLVIKLGNFFVMIYLARLLGPHDFGLIGMLSIFVLISQSLMNSGFSQALIQRSKNITEADASTVFFLNITMGAFLYFLLFISAPYIGAFYKQDILTDISRVLFLVIIIDAFSVVTRAKLIINIDFKSLTISGTIASVFGAIVAIYLAREGYSYWSLVGLTLVRSFCQTIVLAWLSKWRPKLIFSMDSFRQLFGFGSNLLIAGLVGTTVNNLYVILIGRYFNATQVGFFTQAFNLTNTISSIISATLQGVTYPIMTSIKSDKTRLVSIYKQLIEATMLVTLPLMVGLAAIAEPFVQLFLGEKWLPCIPVMVLLCFARAITPISVINLNILNAIGRSDLFLKVNLSKLPMTLIALILSTPYGIESVALAMLCTTFISFFINAYYPKKLFDFGAIQQLKIAYKLFISVFVMYWAVKYVNNDNAILELALKILVGVVSYSLMLLVLKVELFMKMIKDGFKLIKKV